MDIESILGLYHKRILASNSLCSMSMSAGKSFPWNFPEDFVNPVNGHLIKGAKAFLSFIKVPKLPKEENAK